MTSIIAITRAVPAQLQDCELTHQARVPIDIAEARREHAAYEAELAALGCAIVRLPPLDEHADSVFVEDTAVVVEECAVLARPGAASRRGEVASVRAVLQEHRPIREIEAPGTVDGGDVLPVGRRVFVGLSTRTNQAGAAQLQSMLQEFGYDVVMIQVAGALHLKTAVTAVSDDLVVVNAQAIQPASFGVEYLAVPPHEPHGANVLAVNDAVLCPLNAPHTMELLRARGVRVIGVENAELAKAEAGLTCCAILLRSTRV